MNRISSSTSTILIPVRFIFNPKQKQKQIQSSRFLHSSTKQLDFYRTLQVDKRASQKDIKLQFYKLSKQYHPDANSGRDPETYKRKFQEVSEAYATLGSEKGRREYDRRLSSGYSSPGSSQDPSAGSYGYHYDGTSNASRRARATYAWEYQKKRSDTPRARRSNYHRDSSSSSNPNSRSSFGSGLGAGSSPPKGSAADIFSQLAERERKREAARNATANANGSRTTTTPIVDADETGASPIWRFIQVASVFTIVLWIGNKVSGGESQRRERRLIRNQDRLDWKDGSISKLGGELEVEVRKSL